MDQLSATSLDRPILVIGTPRSGKSMIGNVLKAAEEVAVQDETLMMWNLALSRRADDRRTAEEVTEALRHKIVRQCTEQVKKAGKTRYLDNLSYNALRIPFVHRIMPDAKLIHVIRNPDSVIPEMLHGWTRRDSLKRAYRRNRRTLKWRTITPLATRYIINYIHGMMGKRRASWGPRVPELAKFAKSHSAAEVAAYQWLKLVEIAQNDLSALPRSAWLEIRFEDMIERTDPTFERICTFCQLRSPQRVIDHALHYIDPDHLPPHVQNWRVEPTEADWKAIRNVASAKARQLGYESPEP